jgi:hypothetical protein
MKQPGVPEATTVRADRTYDAMAEIMIGSRSRRLTSTSMWPPNVRSCPLHSLDWKGANCDLEISLVNVA